MVYGCKLQPLPFPLRSAIPDKVACGGDGKVGIWKSFGWQAIVSAAISRESKTQWLGNTLASHCDLTCRMREYCRVLGYSSPKYFL